MSEAADGEPAVLRGAPAKGEEEEGTVAGGTGGASGGEADSEVLAQRTGVSLPQRDVRQALNYKRTLLELEVDETVERAALTSFQSCS